MNNVTSFPIFQPSYYADFQCTASACPDTCCGGWNIILNSETYEHWYAMAQPITVDIDGPSILLKNHVIAVPLTGEKARYQLRLDTTGYCPMLTSDRLCSVYREVGQQYMPDVCKQFPRQQIDGERGSERFVSLRCPAVLDLLWKHDAFTYVIAPSSGQPAPLLPSDRPAFPARKLLDTFLSIGNRPKTDPTDLLALLFHSFYQIHSELSLYIPYGADGYREFGQELITEASVRRVIDIASINNQKAPAASGSTHKTTAPKAFFETYHEMLYTLTENFLDSPIFGEDYADAMKASLDLLEQAQPADAARFHDDTFLSDDIRQKLKLVILEQLFSTVFTVQTNDYETILLAVQWLTVQYQAIRYLLFLDIRKGHAVDVELLRHRVSRIFRITDVADLTKLSYFDEKLRCWMWLPAQADAFLCVRANETWRK